MKIRTDFVTNSSSSSFIAVKKGDLNVMQKETILNYIEKLIFCSEKVTSIDSLEEKADDYGILESYREEIEEALKDGQTVYFDYVDFYDDAPVSFITNFYRKLTKILEENSQDNFIGIATDLNY